MTIDTEPEPTKNDGVEPLTMAWRLPAVVAGVIVVLGVAWYFWVLHDWNHAATWAAIGDAVGPFAGLATALALGFAVYATMLQREELKLQREEMQAQREEMKAHREAAESAATAQAELVALQKSLTKAQRKLVVATMATNYTTAKVALEQLRARIAEVKCTGGSGGQAFEKVGKEHVAELDRIVRGAFQDYERTADESND